MLSIKNLSIKLSLGVCAATFAASLSSCLDDNTNYVLHPENFQVETNLIMDIVDSEAQYPEDIIVSRDDDRTPAKLPVIPEGFEVHYVVTIVNSENRAVGAYVVDEPQLNVKLVPGAYNVHAWADFVPVGDRSSRDHWYFTDDISEMLLKEKYAYKGSLAEKRAFAGSKRLTVRLANGASIDERISMTAPMGRFRIINKASGLIPFEIGRVRVSYTNGIWGGHNMNTGEPVIRWNNVGFSGEPSATVDGELAFDNLFVSSTDDETFNILLEIYDTDGNLAARVKNIEFPVRRGHVTDIIGDFCNILEEDEKPVTTPGGGGGIGIDPGFDHEYTIVIK